MPAAKQVDAALPELPDAPRTDAPDLADDIAHMLRHGRKWGPKRIRRLIFIDEDGERTSIALPVVSRAEAEEVEAEPLTDMEAAVLTVLEKVAIGAVIATDEIARRSGFSNNGAMREFLRLLAKSGRLRRVRLGYERIS